jgi:hypothetical protein
MTDSGQVKYWNDRYRQGITPWNIGQANPIWLHFIRSFPPATRILFPGAGHAHEAIVLHREGYTNCWICDWSEEAISLVKEREPDFPEEQLLWKDFFELEERYELIIEQTFFSALPPAWRGRYVRQMHRLLAAEGTLAALLFASPMNSDRPPYGGSEAIYRTLFRPYFHFLQFKISEQSIPPRLGNEFFLEMRPLSEPDSFPAGPDAR